MKLRTVLQNQAHGPPVTGTKDPSVLLNTQEGWGSNLHYNMFSW